MKSKTIGFCLGIFAFVFIGFCAYSVPAQKLPYLLERGTDFSPRNRDDFEKVVKNYTKAICFDEPASCVSDDIEATKWRNILIYATIGQIDINFLKYTRRSRKAREAFEILMDFLKIAADTAAVITNGARPKTIINAGSSLFQLTRQSVGKNLRLQEAQILFNKMETTRLKVLNEILIKIEGGTVNGTTEDAKTDAEYSFAKAWVDIERYYRAGTMDSALAELSASTATEKADAEKALLNKSVTRTP